MASDRPSAEPLRLLAGDCTVTWDAPDAHREERGYLLTVVKPDSTVLVHDAAGYRPVAWLTRAEAVSCSSAEPTVLAQDEDRTLIVRAHDGDGFDRVPTSQAGSPVGTCPDCGSVLVRAAGSVTCLDCTREHGLPGDATIVDDACDCGLPRMRVDRGAALELCVDRECESLDAAVRERFDGEWDCPQCDGDLRVLRRGGLVAGCERYPDCDTGFSLPRGTLVDTCGCGLPVFDTPTGERCLDPNCAAGG